MKLIDSTYRRGRAEREIKFEADFSQFQKRGFSRREILKVDIFEIQKKYNIKGFTFGNFVTQEERYFFLYKISKQLEFLGKIKGSNNLGFGKLVIGFGADGKRGSLAYYKPSEHYININRGRKADYKGLLQGENSFVHEYGHFLDRYNAIYDDTTNVNFASQSLDVLVNGLTVVKSKKKIVQTFSNFVSIARKDKEYMNDLMSFKNKSYVNYLTSTVEIYARLFEETVAVLAKGTPYAKFIPHSKYVRRKEYLGEKRIKSYQLDKFIRPMLQGKAFSRK